MEEQSEARVEAPKKKGGSKFFLVLFVLVIALAGYAGAYYYYTQYTKTKIVLDNPQVASQNEVKTVTDQLSKIYELPKGEEPTVATVLDKEKLKDQPFFAKAENGDKVIIYTKSQLAILFRVSANKIINVSPVSLQAAQQSPAGSPSPSPKVVNTIAPTATPVATTTP